MTAIQLPQIAFFLLSAVAMVSGILVITRKNAVHSIICLIVTLFSVAGVFLMQHAEFLFAVQIILYVGGIMVLFLFVVMLVNLDAAVKQAQFSRGWFVATVTAAVVTGEIVYGIYLSAKHGLQLSPQFPEVVGAKNTPAIAVGLYQTYMLPVEIASLLLLVAMVGAVVMAKRKFE